MKKIKIAFIGKYQLTSIPNIMIDELEFIDNHIFETVLVYQGMRSYEIEWYSPELDKYFYTSIGLLDILLRSENKLIWKQIDSDNCGAFTIKGTFTFCKIESINNILLTLA